MKLLFFDCHSYDKIYFEKVGANFSDIQLDYYNEKLSSTTANMTKGYDGVICFVNDKLDHSCLQKISENGIKAIFLRCAGYNNIDADTARKLNISIYRVPAYSPEAVAEHAVALLMTLNRKTHKSYLRIKEMNFSLEGLVGANLNGKTVGVVGLGKIGKCFCRIMNGFGAKLLAYDPQADLNWCKLNSVTLVSEAALLANSDIISFHCPLNENTHHFLNQNNILKTKQGCIIINTGRGALIETKALIEALKKKHIGGAALDVYEFESELFFTDHSAEIIQDDIISRLTSFPNVLITSHQGFLTSEALTQIAEVTLSNIIDFKNQTQILSHPNRV